MPGRESVVQTLVFPMHGLSYILCSRWFLADISHKDRSSTPEHIGAGIVTCGKRIYLPNIMRLPAKDTSLLASGQYFQDMLDALEVRPIRHVRPARWSGVSSHVQAILHFLCLENARSIRAPWCAAPSCGSPRGR